MYVPLLVALTFTKAEIPSGISAVTITGLFKSLIAVHCKISVLGAADPKAKLTSLIPDPSSLQYAAYHICKYNVIHMHLKISMYIHTCTVSYVHKMLI